MHLESFHSNRTPIYQEYRSRVEELMPDNTSADLNLDDFFERVNRTGSAIGHQYLYYLLRLDKPSDVAQHEALIKQLSQSEPLRTQLTASLKKLNNLDAFSIASLFGAPPVEVTAMQRRVISVCRFVPFLLLGLFFITHWVGFMLLFLASILFNAYLHYRNKSKMSEYYFSAPQLLRLLMQAEKLAASSPLVAVDKGVTEAINDLKPLKKYLKAFRLHVKLDSDMAFLAFLLTELFYMFFLTEAYFATQAYGLLREKMNQVERIYCFVGKLDVLLSVAQLRDELPAYCFPQAPAAGVKLCAEEVYHPLIADCVPNSFELSDKSALITGSNMSGKTSFIRTIGLNFVAGKALNTCFARRFEASLECRISSSISLSDNLMEGESFYLAEVKTVKEFLEHPVTPRLYLLDELFKGTNTAERIAISKAVLSFLGRGNNIVLASTHDLELTELLASEYNLHYFTETVQNGELLFDYKLKAGVLKERNAIRILEINGYPEAVISEAYRVVNN